MTIFYGVLWTLLFLALVWFGILRFAEADGHAKRSNFTGTLWNALWGMFFFYLAMKDVWPHIKAAFA